MIWWHFLKLECLILYKRNYNNMQKRLAQFWNSTQCTVIKNVQYDTKINITLIYNKKDTKIKSILIGRNKWLIFVIVMNWFRIIYQVTSRRPTFLVHMRTFDGSLSHSVRRKLKNWINLILKCISCQA